VSQVEQIVSGRQAELLDLSNNESPLEPSPTVTRALFVATFEANRYPDNSARALREALGATHGVLPDQVVLGNGSSEILDIAARLALREGGEVVSAFPAFGVYQRVALRYGGHLVRVPLRNWRVDLEAMASAVTADTRLLVIGNPNNPTGTTVRGSDLAALVQALPEEVLVVVDEAYAEYVNDPAFRSALELRGAHPGLLVLRTFSKAYGLAGLRIGYGIVAPELAARLERERPTFNTSRLAQAAALAVLEDEAQLERTVSLNRAARQALCERLDGIGLSYVPSQANFVLVSVYDGSAVAEALRLQGILVKPMQAFGLPDCVRISTGTVEEMHRVADRLQQLCTGDAMRMARRAATLEAALHAQSNG
jgi:histidinol-phosphate aminotransferase